MIARFHLLSAERVNISGSLQHRENNESTYHLRGFAADTAMTTERLKLNRCCFCSVTKAPNAACSISREINNFKDSCRILKVRLQLALMIISR